MNGTLPSSSSIILSSTKEKNERPTTPSGVLLDNLDYDWYIQVKVRQSANTTGKVELIEANVLSLVEGKHLNPYVSYIKVALIPPRIEK
jgi:hypothetical protein